MNEIFSEENLLESVKKLITKKDTCGVDGIMVSQYEEYWKMNHEKIISSVVDGSYTPSVVELVELLKSNGKKRNISKYTCTDRVILDVIMREITPL